jgi:hypothetical protein
MPGRADGSASRKIGSNAEAPYKARYEVDILWKVHEAMEKW